MVLGMMGAEFARAMRDSAVATANLAEETQAYGVALAGVNVGIFKALRQREIEEWAGVSDEGGLDEGTGVGQDEEEEDGEEADAFLRSYWTPDGRWYEGEYWMGRYRVRVTDEGGKIGLNVADEALLRQVLKNLGAAEDEQEIITDSILDWRDADSLHRLHGAEASFYMDLPNPYMPKDGPFDTVDELLLVRGVSRELFFGEEAKREGEEGRARVPLRSIFTVFNQTGTINLRTASADVLRALLGLEDEDLEEVLELRESDPRAALLKARASAADPLLGRRLVYRRTITVMIEAEAKMNEGRMPARVTAVVDLSEDADGFHLKRWIDRSPAFPAGIGTEGSGA